MSSRIILSLSPAQRSYSPLPPRPAGSNSRCDYYLSSRERRQRCAITAHTRCAALAHVRKCSPLPPRGRVPAFRAVGASFWCTRHQRRVRASPKVYRFATCAVLIQLHRFAAPVPFRYTYRPATGVPFCGTRTVSLHVSSRYRCTVLRHPYRFETVCGSAQVYRFATHGRLARGVPVQHVGCRHVACVRGTWCAGTWGAGVARGVPPAGTNG